MKMSTRGSFGPSACAIAFAVTAMIAPSAPAGGAWTVVAGHVANAGTTTTFTHPAAGDATRFYRIAEN